MIPPLSCATKTLRILQVFSDDRAELGGTQIDKLVMSHKCSVYRILTPLMVGGFVKLPAHRAGLPGNESMIIGSALTPLRESVSALPAPAAGRRGHPADLPVADPVSEQMK
jgi:hypothetical protein